MNFPGSPIRKSDIKSNYRAMSSQMKALIGHIRQYNKLVP